MVARVEDGMKNSFGVFSFVVGVVLSISLDWSGEASMVSSPKSSAR